MITHNKIHCVQVGQRYRSNWKIIIIIKKVKNLAKKENNYVIEKNSTVLLVQNHSA